MTQSLDLNKMGLTPMNEFEMMEVEGGSFWTWLAGAGLAVLAVGLTIGTGGLALVAAASATTVAEVGAGMFVGGVIGEWIFGR